MQVGNYDPENYLVQVHPGESERMAVVLDDGDIRLVTFSFAREPTAYQAIPVDIILDEVGIEFNPHEKIELIRDPSPFFHYLLRLGSFKVSTARIVEFVENYLMQKEEVDDIGIKIEALTMNVVDAEEPMES